MDGEGVPRWVCNDIAREMAETGERDPERARRRMVERDIEACEAAMAERGLDHPKCHHEGCPGYAEPTGGG